MNILVIGSGGREHALTWKLNQSPQHPKIFVAPGNAGTSTIATNIKVDPSDFEGISKIILEQKIQMLVVGPENPLVDGIRDYFENKEGFESLMIIGPGKSGARLEGSKDFSKAFMNRNGIPTAGHKTFTVDTLNQGLAYIARQKPPIVIKADGLAAGKGVIIANSVEEACNAMKSMLIDQKFAASGHKVLVEQYLSGIELSVFVLTDGTNYKILPEAKDYKRIGENDTGPNTGGMGAVSPVPFAHRGFLSKIEKKVVRPTLSGLKKENIKYIGFLFLGLMKVNGEPYMIEYNVRMGDPETQVVMPRIDADLVELLSATAKGKLNQVASDTFPEFASTVVGVSDGYPGSYQKGKLISGLGEIKDGICFEAGTKQSPDGTVTNGGRVLAVTGKGSTLQDSLEEAYAGIRSLSWEGMQYRSDIGKDILKMEPQLS